MVGPMKDDHLTALENLAVAARDLERIVSGTTHPGIEHEKSMALDKLVKRVHELDELEGKRQPVGQPEKWQEEMAGPK